MTFEEAHRSIKRADLLAIRRALDSGLDPNISNRFGWTPLILSAIKGNTRIAELLVSRGANVHTTTKWGDTALSIAALEGHLNFVRRLLALGASTDCRPWGLELDALIKQGSSMSADKMAIMLAALGYRQRLN
jgi:ankyrin repeat protein